MIDATSIIGLANQLRDADALGVPMEPPTERVQGVVRTYGAVTVAPAFGLAVNARNSSASGSAIGNADVES